MSPKKKSDIKWRRSFQCAIQCHEIDAYFSFTNQIWKIKENTLLNSCFMIKFKKNFKKFNFNTKPNAWTIRFNEIYEYFLCVTPKTVFFSCGCKYHIFIDFHLMYCWHILANKHHDMPDTNYDKFNLVVSTLFLNKWYLKKSTFFENDPYIHRKYYKTDDWSISGFLNWIIYHVHIILLFLCSRHLRWYVGHDPKCSSWNYQIS